MRSLKQFTRVLIAMCLMKIVKHRMSKDPVTWLRFIRALEDKMQRDLFPNYPKGSLYYIVGDEPYPSDVFEPPIIDRRFNYELRYARTEYYASKFKLSRHFASRLALWGVPPQEILVWTQQEITYRNITGSWKMEIFNFQSGIRRHLESGGSNAEEAFVDKQ